MWLGFEVYWVGRWWLDGTRVYHRKPGQGNKELCGSFADLEQPETTEGERWKDVVVFFLILFLSTIYLFTERVYHIAPTGELKSGVLAGSQLPAPSLLLPPDTGGVLTTSSFILKS